MALLVGPLPDDELDSARVGRVDAIAAYDGLGVFPEVCVFAGTESDKTEPRESALMSLINSAVSSPTTPPLPVRLSPGCPSSIVLPSLSISFARPDVPSVAGTGGK